MTLMLCVLFLVAVRVFVVSVLLVYGFTHGRMARGGHGLPKVSIGHAMPDPSRPAGETHVKRPSSTHLDTPRRTPMVLLTPCPPLLANPASQLRAFETFDFNTVVEIP
jgi:hypothetical protein